MKFQLNSNDNSICFYYEEILIDEASIRDGVNYEELVHSVMISKLKLMSSETGNKKELKMIITKNIADASDISIQFKLENVKEKL
jgi:hypothetical protein